MMTIVRRSGWIAALLFVAQAGCDQVAPNKQSNSSAPVVTGSAAASSGASAAASPRPADGPAPPATPGADFLVDASAAIDAIKKRVGGSAVRVKQVSLYPKYVSVEAQDPNKKDHVDQFEFRDAQVSAPTPVKFTGEPTLEKIEATLFGIDEVDFKKIPGLIEDTAKRLPFEDGKVTHVIVERSVHFKDAVVVQVRMKSPRNNGFVVYDASGKMLKEHR